MGPLRGPSPRAALRALVIGVVAICGRLVVVGLPASAAPPEVPFRLGGDAVKGRSLFNYACASCHGLAGDGRSEMAGVLKPPPSDLTDVGRMGKLSDWDLYRLIRDGGPALGLSPSMLPFKPVLPDADLRSVAAFVRTLAKRRR